MARPWLRHTLSVASEDGLEAATRGLLIASILVFPVAKVVQLALGVNNNPPLFDFGVYYQTSLVPTEELYTSRYDLIPNTATEYLYPPLVSLLFRPLVLLPFRLSGMVWQFSTAVLLFAGVARLYRDAADAPPKVSLIVGLLALCSAPIVSGLALGQVTPLLIALMCFSSSSALCDEAGRSGVTAALPGLVKPMYLGFGVHLLRDRRRFATSVLTVALLTAVSVALFGIQLHLDYLAVLRGGKGWGAIVPPSEWTAGTFRPFFVFGRYHLIPKLGVAALSTTLVLWSAGSGDGGTERLSLALACLTVPLISPSPNTLILGACIPAVVLLLSVERTLSDGVPSAVYALAALIPLQPILVATVAGFGPSVVPDIALLSPLLPIVQPAAWGVLGLYALTGFRLADSRRSESSRLFRR